MKSYVALGSSICPACGKIKKDDSIILDKYMKERFEYGKTYISDIKLCNKCQDHVDCGRIGIVEVKPNADLYNASLEKILMGIERTGRLFWLNKKVFTKEFIEKNRNFLFLEPSHLDQLLELLRYEEKE